MSHPRHHGLRARNVAATRIRRLALNDWPWELPIVVLVVLLIAALVVLVT